MREFVELAFEHAGLDRDEHVAVDPRFMRPAEVDQLVGDARRRGASSAGSRGRLRELVEMMVDADLERVANELAWAKG